MDEKEANGGWIGTTVLAFGILLVAGIYFKVENQKLESDIKEEEMKIEELKKIERKNERDLDGCINEKTRSEEAKTLQEKMNERDLDALKGKIQKLESDIKVKEMKIEELMKIERDLDGCINEKTLLQNLTASMMLCRWTILIAIKSYQS